MTVLRKPKIVVLGMMSRMRVAGAVWQTLHYLLGLQRLGYDVFYIEAHGCLSWAFLENEVQAAEFIDGIMKRFDMAHQWAFHARHASGRCYGMSEHQVRELYREASAVINLHGGTEPTPEHIASQNLVYIETDPGWVQVQVHEGERRILDLLEPHCAFFTFGENYGKPDCSLPVSDRFQFRPTRQPVVLDLWDAYGVSESGKITTVGNWRQSRRVVVYEGEEYQWSKHFEFLKFLDVPKCTSQKFELALSGFDTSDRALLEASGWEVRDAANFSLDFELYKQYIAGSRGEFTVAKDQNIRFRTAWFSDRSATYLAAARPVITQETGFSKFLPTGEGLFSFSTKDEVLAAVDAINGDYERQRRAAMAVAREYFSYDIVLPRLLSEAGIDAAKSRSVGGSRHRHQVNVIGAFSAQTGLGETARRYVRALEAAGIKVNPVETSLLRADSPPLCDGEEGVNIICSDIASQPATPSMLAKGPLHRGYNIALWLWELRSIPRRYREHFAYYNEIWAPTSFLTDAFGSVSPIPVVTLPHPLLPGSEGDRARGRQRLGLDADAYIFTFVFNFFSRIERKNPMGVIDSFKAAFKPHESAHLVIKCLNSDFSADHFHTLERMTEGQHISICDDEWPRAQMVDLMAATDCYVSLHRAEGVGLPIGDAMAAGKPVIATGWSGNMDFMNVSNSFPVRFRLMELETDVGHYPKGSIYAEPDLEHAAELMRYVFERREEGARRGNIARAEIRAWYSEITAGKAIASRLELISQRRKLHELQRQLHSPIEDLPRFSASFKTLGEYVPEHALHYESVKQGVRRVILSCLPSTANVLILSGGDDELIDLGERRGWHFPQGNQREYAGFHPRDSAEAIRNLELVRRHGGEFLVFPEPSFWWLDHYREFHEYLQQKYAVAYSDQCCLIYDLSGRRDDPFRSEAYEIYQA